MQKTQGGYLLSSLSPGDSAAYLAGNPSFSEGIPTMLSAIIAAIARRRARARAIAELQRLDDAHLRDIGLMRDQIEAFVSGRI